MPLALLLSWCRIVQVCVQLATGDIRIYQQGAVQHPRKHADEETIMADIAQTNAMSARVCSATTGGDELAPQVFFDCFFCKRHDHASYWRWSRWLIINTAALVGAERRRRARRGRICIRHGPELYLAQALGDSQPNAFPAPPGGATSHRSHPGELAKQAVCWGVWKPKPLGFQNGRRNRQ